MFPYQLYYSLNRRKYQTSINGYLHGGLPFYIDYGKMNFFGKENNKQIAQSSQYLI